MKVIDLQHGEPKFLARYWDRPGYYQHYLSPDLYKDHLEYPKQQPELQLRSSIIALHEAVGNVKIHDKHLVIGNGATQLIGAILASFKSGKLADTIDPIGTVTVDSPYWFRMPHIVNSKGMLESPNGDYRTNASPANPSGALVSTNDLGSIALLDLAYHWPQYYNPGEEIRKVDHPITVFSMAKATGHAGYRIGWALLDNKELADAVSAYIENESSGVSTIAQKAASEILDTQSYAVRYGRVTAITSVFEEARQILYNRRATCHKLLIDLGFEPLDERGMFLWFRVPNEDAELYLRDNLGILGISGTKFGDKIDTARLNLGCDPASYEALIRRLKDAADQES